MSQRMGMADGRCLTSYESSKIMNDTLMLKQGIAFQDNYRYRTYLQNTSLEGLNLPLKNAACRTSLPKPLVEDE